MKSWLRRSHSTTSVCVRSRSWKEESCRRRVGPAAAGVKPRAHTREHTHRRAERNAPPRRMARTCLSEGGHKLEQGGAPDHGRLLVSLPTEGLQAAPGGAEEHQGGVTHVGDASSGEVGACGSCLTDLLQIRLERARRCTLPGSTHLSAKPLVPSAAPSSTCAYFFADLVSFEARSLRRSRLPSSSVTLLQQVRNDGKAGDSRRPSPEAGRGMTGGRGTVWRTRRTVEQQQQRTCGKAASPGGR